MSRLSWRAANLLIRRGLFNKEKLRRVQETEGLLSIPGVGTHIEKELLEWLDSKEDEYGRTPEGELPESYNVLTPEPSRAELKKKVRELNLMVDELRRQKEELVQANIDMEMYLSETHMIGKYRIWRKKL